MPDTEKELAAFGIDAVIHDPLADTALAKHEYGFDLVKWGDMRNLPGVILAVSHRQYEDVGREKLLSLVCLGGVVIDVRSALRPNAIDRTLRC